jgi:predicted kinase
MKIILITGPIAAGKTTYAIRLASELSAIRFSIDAWMTTLFSEDNLENDFLAIMARVDRCHNQIWSVALQALDINLSVVLDLGFTTAEQRSKFINLALSLGITPELHYLQLAPKARWQRVVQRNNDKHPDVFSFEITQEMIDFMEPKFEPPILTECDNFKIIHASSR